MTSESSGIWNSPNTTPTGAPFQYPVDHSYMSTSEFLTHPVVVDGLGLKNTDAIILNGYVDNLLLRTSAWINRYTNRYFDVQTVDETYPNISIRPENPSPITVTLRNAPINSINTIYVQVLKWFIPFSLDYLINYAPDFGTYQIVPLLSSAGGIASPLPSPLLDRPALGIIWTNYTFGYTAIPADIKEAVVLYAAQKISNQRNPIGLTRFKTGEMMMDWEFDKDPVMHQIKEILEPYRRIVLRAV